MILTKAASSSLLFLLLNNHTPSKAFRHSTVLFPQSSFSANKKFLSSSSSTLSFSSEALNSNSSSNSQQQTNNKTGCQNQTRNMSSTATTTDSDIPPLVYIGDKELMAPVPSCLPKNNNHNHDNNDAFMKRLITTDAAFAAQLQTLQRCQTHYGGIGIAACQVGWRARVFTMGIAPEDTAARARYPGAPPFERSVWIEPTLEFDLEDSMDDENDDNNNHQTNYFWEGCLSVPGMRGWVERPTTCRIRGWNEHGEYRHETLTGLAARVAQHEYDHLDGILFPHRAEAGTIVPLASFTDGKQDEWADGWPTAGARRTRPGEFSNEK